ncbi:MAG: RecQ family ATP-dependent DNA helicase [Spirochaetaceae bacterium]|jgi:ATP-dependent DNA helicase RecQ|nr:RecQ family ATP-dependent DNA helicase [Spirochaetaceae bacterium]
MLKHLFPLFPLFPHEEAADPLDAAARSLFGIPYLLPYQKLVIAGILEAAEALRAPAEGGMPDDDRRCLRHRIVILPTGAGKSLCFQVPALFLDGVTVVIYPLLALMADQVRRLEERGIEAAVLRGGQSPAERGAQWEKLRSGRSRFLITNPETLLAAAARERLKTLRIAHLVIDEAHCVSEWGETFRPSYLNIRAIIDSASPLLVSAFTATASAAVLEKIRAGIFGTSGAHTVMANPDRPSITYGAVGCVLRDGAVQDLLAKSERPALVFCSSRVGAQTLARFLRTGLRDKEIRFYHAGLSRQEKALVENWFFSSAQGILAATCAYGMGMDKPDIRTVIHRDCPPSVEAYLQESGRAGRDGGPARAVLLFGPEDRRRLVRAGSPAERERQVKLIEYAEGAGQCRRAALLRMLDYQGEPEAPRYGCCDVCAGTAKNILREEPGLTAFFRRNPRRFTIAEASRELSSGAGPGIFSASEAFKAVQGLLEQGSLRQTGGFFWKGAITLNKKASKG